MKFMLYNVQGLTRYKLSDPQFIDYITKYDLIMLCETWTSAKSNFTIPNYEAFYSHRPKRNKKAKRCSGGVIIYVKERLLGAVSMIKNDIPDILWLKIDRKYIGTAKDLLICACYIAPQYTQGVQ